MESWAFGLSAISAFFAAIAAIANLGQARKASQANEVNIYIALLKQYGTNEMREAIATMAKLFKQQNGRIVEWYAGEYQRNPQSAENLYKMARPIVSHFVHCAILFESGLISKKLLREIISTPGLNVFYQVAVPLTLAGNPHNDVKNYMSVLKRCVDKHGDGLIY